MFVGMGLQIPFDARSGPLMVRHEGDGHYVLRAQTEQDGPWEDLLILDRYRALRLVQYLSKYLGDDEQVARWGEDSIPPEFRSPPDA